MRFEDGKLITLEQDIVDVWRKHGLAVARETFGVDEDGVAKWIIEVDGYGE